MKVVTLLENTACTADLRHAHGLSLYLEAGSHRILFDMGPNAGFLENAEKLGVNLAAVDVAFLSHGHYDHAGGLELFCKRNKTAKIYVNRLAFGEFYAEREGQEPEYIGVDPKLERYHSRFVLTDAEVTVDAELRVFSDVRTNDYHSSANDTLRMKRGDDLPPDDFHHEQNLLITAEGKTVLLAGCAHRGIVNILRRAEEILGKAPDAVIAGFHLYNPGTGEPEPRSLIEAVGRELADRPTMYYTGHCTGQEAYDILKEILGGRLNRLSGGAEFII